MTLKPHKQDSGLLQVMGGGCPAYSFGALAGVAGAGTFFSGAFTDLAAAAESAKDSKIFMMGLSAVLTMILR